MHAKGMGPLLIPQAQTPLKGIGIGTGKKWGGANAYTAPPEPILEMDLDLELGMELGHHQNRNRNKD